MYKIALAYFEICNGVSELLQIHLYINFLILRLKNMLRKDAKTSIKYTDNRSFLRNERLRPEACCMLR